MDHILNMLLKKI